jgi:hypothetical protein
MKKHKFSRGLFGGYIYIIKYGDRVFVSKRFNTPLEAITSFKKH